MANKLQQFVRLTPLNGYKSGSSVAGPDADPNTIYRGQNFWIRAGGRLKPIKGILQIAAVNLGSRIYPLDIYRGEIGGALVSSRLPKESLVRYQRSALFYVSENVSQQVYINESTTTPFTLTGVLTSATAGKLKVAILSGTTFTPYDAGLDAPVSIGTVAAEDGGSKSMIGIVSIRSAARRITTDTTGNPTAASVVTTLNGTTIDRIRVTLPSMVSGQEGWVFGGTPWGRGNQGPWKVIREFQTAFSVTATNGSPTISGTELSRNLRPGDRVTINATQYYIGAGATAPTDTTATLTSDAAGTTPLNFAGATNTYTLTINEVALDWRDNELNDEIEFDNDLPPLLDGILLFNDVPFGWKGNTIVPSKIGNPEAFPRRLRRTTQSGGDIVHAIAGNARMYVMTTNGLELVTFTNLDEAPFLIRQIWGFGFSSPAQGVVAEGSFFGAVGTSRGVKIVRTREDQSPDFEFSSDVEFEMLDWDVADVVMGFDPANAAVLAMHDEGSTTQVIPFMLQLGQWSVPQIFTGSIKTGAVVSNNFEMILDVGTFRANRFEGGDGTGIDKYVVWPFIDAPVDGFRKIIKRIKATLDAANLYIYAAVPGDNVPDVTNLGEITAGPFPLSTGMQHEIVINTNVQNCQSYAIRVDTSQSDAEVQEISVYGLVNGVYR